MNKHFKFSSDVVKTLSLKSFSMSLVLVFFGLILGVLLNVKQGLESSAFIFFPFIIIAITLGIALRNGMKRKRQAYNSYELIISSESIVQRQIGISELTIMRDEIVSIIEYQNKCLHIQSIDEKNTMFIPKKLSGYEEIKEILSDWKFIELKETRFNYNNLMMLLQILIICATATVFLSDNKLIVIPVGLLLIIVLIISDIIILKSKQVDNRTKRLGGLGLLVSCVIVFKMFAVL